MLTKANKNHEMMMNTMWQRNLSAARDIRIDLQKVLDSNFHMIRELLHSFESFNETDSAGLLLSLLSCIGHFAGNSSVSVANHTTNLNLFLLLIGPSGKIILKKLRCLFIQ